MTRCPTIVTILILLLCTACKGNKFSLEFELPENVEANYDVVYYADSRKGGLTVQTVAPVIGGKCVLGGITALPTIIYLNSRKYRVPVIIYVNKGDVIKITGESADPYTWDIKGGDKINETLTLWRNENAEILSKGSPEEVNGCVASYIEEHPENPVSALLLLTNFNRREDESGYVELAKTLTGEARDPKWMSLVSRADVISLSVKDPSEMKSMIMRAYPEGTDTIFTYKSDGVLMIFRELSGDYRKPLFDSIRAVVKEFPDSSTRIIADVVFDADSLTWRNSIRRDTVAGMARFFVPAGFVDSEIMKLSVPRIPFFIVFSPDGKQIYRGSEQDSAINVFRSMLSEKNK